MSKAAKRNHSRRRKPSTIVIGEPRLNDPKAMERFIDKMTHDFLDIVADDGKAEAISASELKGYRCVGAAHDGKPIYVPNEMPDHEAEIARKVLDSTIQSETRRLNALVNGCAAKADAPKVEAPKDTPFKRVEHALFSVQMLEARVRSLIDQLVGYDEKNGSTDAPTPVGELNKLIDTSANITASVKRMHDMLDRLVPVLP